MSKAVSVAQHPDGRVQRGRRNREAVVEAFLSLIEDGDPQPRARAIAARAGVSTRSVFQHFNDLESLYLVAGQREAKKIAAMLPPVDPSLSCPERIEIFVAQRARALEALAPVASAARLREPHSAQLRANRHAFIEQARRYCGMTFAPELAGREEPERTVVLDALVILSSFNTWDGLRGDQGLDVDAAAAVLRALLGGLLASPVFAERLSGGLAGA